MGSGLIGGDTFENLVIERFADNIVAFAGGGQASATPMIAQTNRIITVATSGDSVKLPPSASGLEVTVINHGANPVQIFGNGTDTINDQAAATGVLLPANAVDIFVCATRGSWYAEVGVGFSGQLFTELALDTITARAGGGQALATQLTAQTSRVTVVATAGDSVKLPASAPGLELMLINHGANPMQVFGSGTDTIDDIATATGVSQMQNSLVIYTCTTAGAWYTEGLATGFGGPGLQTMSTASAITAFAGGGQTGNAQSNLTNMINRLAVVATIGDSATLPASKVGLSVFIANDAANSANVFPALGDSINALGANTAFALAGGKNAMFYCTIAGKWHAVLSA